MLTRRSMARLACLAAATLTAAACGGGGGFSDGGSPSQNSGEASLQVMIGSSGPAETDAVTAAVDAWASDTGNTAEVIAATDLNQQLSQGFAAGSPPDVFYMSSDTFAGYAANGSLLPYAGEMDTAGDFYPNLVEAFTFEDQYYCAPKDFSTLGLEINNASWAAAGLTDADIPTTWDELHEVALKLTTGGQTGLVTSSEYQRLGAFMAQAGGGLVTDGAATADSEANVAALQFVQSMLADGSWQLTGQVGAGWGGEAFGTGLAAMTIEGNWIAGAMTADYPDIDYQVVPLPAGPEGQASLSFTNCWGIAADSPNQEAAKDLVSFLTSPDQQMEFARAFGVMPSVSTAKDTFISEFPAFAAFVEQAEGAATVPNGEGVADVIADLNSQLEGLPGADAAAILASAQTNLEAALGQ